MKKNIFFVVLSTLSFSSASFAENFFKNIHALYEQGSPATIADIDVNTLIAGKVVKHESPEYAESKNLLVMLMGDAIIGETYYSDTFYPEVRGEPVTLQDAQSMLDDAISRGQFKSSLKANAGSRALVQSKNRGSECYHTHGFRKLVHAPSGKTLLIMKVTVSEACRDNIPDSTYAVGYFDIT